MPLKCGPNIRRYTAAGDGVDADQLVAMVLMQADFATNFARVQKRIKKLKATACPVICSGRNGEIDALTKPGFTVQYNAKLRKFHAHIQVTWVWQVNCVPV